MTTQPEDGRAAIQRRLDLLATQIDAADRRGAPYAEVYRLVRRENAARAELEAMDKPPPVMNPDET